jgi:hypothetical protein
MKTVSFRSGSPLGFEWKLRQIRANAAIKLACGEPVESGIHFCTRGTEKLKFAQVDREVLGRPRTSEPFRAEKH